MQPMTAQEKDVVKAGILLAVVLFAAVAYYYYFLVTDQVRGDKIRIEGIAGDIKKLEAEQRDIASAFDNLEQLKKKAEYLKRIERKLPDRPDAPGFFQALTRILEVTRVTYSELTPLQQVVRTVYTEIPYRVKCRARYHDFGQFLNLIEENPDRFMRVKTFTIDNDDLRPSLHPIEVEIGTFMFNSKG